MATLRAVATALIVLSAASSTQAAPVTSTGGGQLTAFPGFSYEYTATWEASAGSFQFGLTAQSFTSNNLPRIIFNGAFTTTTPLLDVPSFDFLASVDMRVFNTATGVTQSPIANIAAQGSTGAGYAASPLPGAQFRYSNPLLATNSVLAGIGNVGSLTPKYTTSTHFEPGHIAISSSDPNCASVACMGVGQDRLAITNAGSFFYQLQPVPEPGTMAMLLTGCVALVVHAKRRRVTG